MSCSYICCGLNSAWNSACEGCFDISSFFVTALACFSPFCPPLDQQTDNLLLPWSLGPGKQSADGLIQRFVSSKFNASSVHSAQHGQETLSSLHTSHPHPTPSFPPCQTNCPLTFLPTHLDLRNFLTDLSIALHNPPSNPHPFFFSDLPQSVSFPATRFSVSSRPTCYHRPVRALLHCRLSISSPSTYTHFSRVKVSQTVHDDYESPK